MGGEVTDVIKAMTPAEAQAVFADPVAEEIASLNARLAEGTCWMSVSLRLADAVSASAREAGWRVVATPHSDNLFMLLEFSAEVPS